MKALKIFQERSFATAPFVTSWKKELSPGTAILTGRREMVELMKATTARSSNYHPGWNLSHGQGGYPPTPSSRPDFCGSGDRRPPDHGNRLHYARIISANKNATVMAVAAKGLDLSDRGLTQGALRAQSKPFAAP